MEGLEMKAVRNVYTVMRNLTIFYELRVKELTLWTCHGKGSQGCGHIPQTVQSAPAISHQLVSAHCASKPQKTAAVSRSLRRKPEMPGN